METQAPILLEAPSQWGTRMWGPHTAVSPRWLRAGRSMEGTPSPPSSGTPGTSLTRQIRLPPGTPSLPSCAARAPDHPAVSVPEEGPSQAVSSLARRGPRGPRGGLGGRSTHCEREEGDGHHAGLGWRRDSQQVTPGWSSHPPAKSLEEGPGGDRTLEKPSVRVRPRGAGLHTHLRKMKGNSPG